MTGAILRPRTFRGWASWRLRQLKHDESGPYRNPILAGFDAGVRDATFVAKLAVLGFPWSRGTVVADRFELLDRAIRFASPEGLWMEFGVARGRTIEFIAERSSRSVFGFDSFEGLPEQWSPRMPPGHFSTGGVPPPAPPNVVFVKGLFDQSLPAFLENRPERQAAFVHVDCDLYSSTRTVLSRLGPRIQVGSVLVFDEFCGLLPDDECRAWREHCRQYHLGFDWIGASRGGGVAVRVSSDKTS
jgi:hypothetical protein